MPDKIQSFSYRKPIFNSAAYMCRLFQTRTDIWIESLSYFLYSVLFNMYFVGLFSCLLICFLSKTLMFLSSVLKWNSNLINHLNKWFLLVCLFLWFLNFNMNQHLLSCLSKILIFLPIPPGGLYPAEMYTQIHQKTCIRMLIAAWVIKAAYSCHHQSQNELKKIRSQ